MSDQDEPDRLSHEWHAREAEDEALATQWMMDSSDYPSETELKEALEEILDLAAKLRQAAVDAAEVEELRAFLRDIAKGDDLTHLFELQEQAQFYISKEATDE